MLIIFSYDKLGRFAVACEHDPNSVLFIGDGVANVCEFVPGANTFQLFTKVNLHSMVRRFVYDASTGGLLVGDEFCERLGFTQPLDMPRNCVTILMLKQRNAEQHFTNSSGIAKMAMSNYIEKNEDDANEDRDLPRFVLFPRA